MKFTTLAFLLSLGLVLLIGATLRLLLTLGRQVPDENRAFLDTLPRPLRLLWPIVRFIDFHCAQCYPRKLVEYVHVQLRLAGRAHLMLATQFLSLSVVTMVVGLVLGALTKHCMAVDTWLLPAGLAVTGVSLPRLWLRDKRNRAVKQIKQQLPVYLDLLTLSIDAGLNINGAMTQCVGKGPPGVLKREFEHVLRDLKSGLTRTEGLRRMEQRLRVREVTNFVAVVVQAERMGSSLVMTLRFQAEQRRAERFQRAEKMAMQAPVKLLFPLVVFIFPVTFIALAFPIVIKFLNDGLL